MPHLQDPLSRRAGGLISLVLLVVVSACGKRPTSVQAATDGSLKSSVSTHRSHILRLTGTVQAVHSLNVRIPTIQGQGGNLTLIKLVASGTAVRQGDTLAEFDPTAEVQAERDARAKYDDLRHQIESKIAENRSNAEARASALQQAEADLAKAKLEIKKGPILSSIDAEKNRAKLEDAEAHAASLTRSNHFHDLSEAAQLRLLELQRDRQQVAVDRARTNMDKMVMRAPLSGMVALENVWKNGSMGHATEGDQLYPGSPLLQIFDPSVMEVRLSVNEPDGALLKPGLAATVYLDAYPELGFPAVFDSADPVASSANGTPLKTFDVRFRFRSHDPHLLPDLSAAVDIAPPGERE